MYFNSKININIKNLSENQIPYINENFKKMYMYFFPIFSLWRN